MGCRRDPQYDGKCSFYFNCYFFGTTPTNQDLRQKAVYFPALSCNRANDLLIKPVDLAHETAIYIPTMVE